MKKIMIFGLIAAAMWVGSVIRNEGTDKAFGGVFAPAESVRSSESIAVLSVTPAAQMGHVPSQHSMDAGRVTGDVRKRLNAASANRR